MNPSSWTIEGVLGSPLLWGFFAIVAIGIALSGRFDMAGARLCLIVAWIMSVWAIYRFPPVRELSVIPRVMVTMIAVGVLGLALHVLALWLDTRDIDTAELANTSKAQEAFIMDTYTEVTQFNYKQGEVITLVTNLLADGRKIPSWQDEIQDLINRGILMQTKVATKVVVDPNSSAIGERISNAFLTPKGKSLAKDILYIRSHPQVNVARPKE